MMLDNLDPSSPPEDPRGFLRSVPMLAELDVEALEALLAQLVWVRVRSARTVLRAGEDADAMYWIVSGRVAVLDERDEVVAEVGQGFQFGEVGLLISAPRSATIWTLRDTELARLPRAAFDTLTRTYPSLQLALARALARRLASGGSGLRKAADLSTVAVVPLSGAVRDFARTLVDAYDPEHRPFLVDEDWLEQAVGQEEVSAATRVLAVDQQITVALNRLEHEHRVVLFAANETPGSWTRRCLRQADRVLIVASASGPPTLGPLAELMKILAEVKTGTPTELVLVHSPTTVLPSGTAAWLALHPFSFHHHLRAGSEADLARLIRHLRGASVGLVLGGGGARAFAHAGALRRLREAGVPVDRIGGASMGAVVAAWYAMHQDPASFEVLARRFAKARVQWELTLPFISFLSVGRARRLYREVFGAIHFEDLWIPTFGLTVNLSRCDLHVHRRGPLGPLLMAGASPPGIWPPGVTAQGELIVDGGVLDNMPVAIMRKIADGPVIGVDVSSDDPLLVPQHLAGPPGALRFLARLLNPFSKSPIFPNIYRILLRTAAVTGTRREMQARDLADLYLQPPVQEFTIGDYHRTQELMSLGYAAADAAVGDLDWDAVGPHGARISRDGGTAAVPRPDEDGR